MLYLILAILLNFIISFCLIYYMVRIYYVYKILIRAVQLVQTSNEDMVGLVKKINTNQTEFDRVIDVILKCVNVLTEKVVHIEGNEETRKEMDGANKKNKSN